jgi:outer membrane protein OmpA-like peptidoglycan-associated protein
MDLAAVRAIKTAQATGGTAFTTALFTEYQAYTRHEAEDESEWDDAAFFARKGLKAAAGEVVSPEEMAAWPKVPAGRVKELADARSRLLGYFDQGARDRVPAAAAKAQAKFDCWVEEEAEGDSDSSCRAEFLKVELQLKLKVVEAPTPVVAPKIVKTFVVYFDLGKSDLTAASRKTLSEVVVSQMEIKPLNVFVAGHTDTVGSTALNDKLAAVRAKVVAVELNRMGVEAKALDVKSHGEAKLAVVTADNITEMKNRRVEIYFEK